MVGGQGSASDSERASAPTASSVLSLPMGLGKGSGGRAGSGVTFPSFCMWLLRLREDTCAAVRLSGQQQEPNSPAKGGEEAPPQCPAPPFLTDQLCPPTPRLGRWSRQGWCGVCEVWRYLLPPSGCCFTYRLLTHLFYFLKTILIFIEIQLTYNMLVSGVQRTDLIFVS